MHSFLKQDKPANTLESGTEPRYEMFMYNEEVGGLSLMQLNAECSCINYRDSRVCQN